jgi:hypothetical protein
MKIRKFTVHRVLVRDMDRESAPIVDVHSDEGRGESLRGQNWTSGKHLPDNFT